MSTPHTPQNSALTRWHNLLIFLGVGTAAFTVLLKIGDFSCGSGDCNSVLHSRYAALFGVPVGLFGVLVWVAAALCGGFFPADQAPSSNPSPETAKPKDALGLNNPADLGLHICKIALGSGALVFSYLQFVKLKGFCPYCTAHAAIALLFALTPNKTSSPWALVFGLVAALLGGTLQHRQNANAELPNVLAVAALSPQGPQPTTGPDSAPQAVSLTRSRLPNEKWLYTPYGSATFPGLSLPTEIKTRGYSLLCRHCRKEMTAKLKRNEALGPIVFGGDNASPWTIALLAYSLGGSDAQEQKARFLTALSALAAEKKLTETVGNFHDFLDQNDPQWRRQETAATAWTETQMRTLREAKVSYFPSTLTLIEAQPKAFEPRSLPASHVAVRTASALR